MKLHKYYYISINVFIIFYDITYKFLKYMFVVNTVYDILINRNKNILL